MLKVSSALRGAKENTMDARKPGCFAFAYCFVFCFLVFIHECVQELSLRLPVSIRSARNGLPVHVEPVTTYAESWSSILSGLEWFAATATFSNIAPLDSVYGIVCVCVFMFVKSSVTR